MKEFEELLHLPGTLQEEAWLRERLETLSVKEGIALAAASLRQPPSTKAEAINHLLSLSDYDVCFPAGSYSQLGKFCLRYEAHLPEDAIPYTDTEKLGERYEDSHPGLFIGACYVAYPKGTSAPSYDGNGVTIPKDDRWSVKVKLASPTCPEGVWLSLPDLSNILGHPGEVEIALDELHARNLEECTLLDAKCIMLELGDLLAQYESAMELVNDGANLGYILDEQGQGMPHFEERLSAALEYENCHDLRFALNIAQNLQCYEWVSCEDIRKLAERDLKDKGVSEELIHSGCIDLQGYGTEILASAGYVQTHGGSAYVTRNNREFISAYEHNEPQGGTMQMT